MKTRPVCQRHGSVLLIGTVLLFVLAYIGYSFSYRMEAEAMAASFAAERAQARLLAESGIERALTLLALPHEMQADWYGDEAELFERVELIDPEGQFVGEVSLVTHDEEGLGHGVTDEAGKINLNTASAEMLALLPGMTEELADAIQDWRDPDDRTRPQGAESEYYSTLAIPRECKNAEFDTVEELLLVRGCTPQLLYGIDRNRNGMIELAEARAAEEDDVGPQLEFRQTANELGVVRFLTVYSREPNVDARGRLRLNLNGARGQDLDAEVSRSFSRGHAEFVQDYLKENKKLSSVADLIGAEVKVKSKKKGGKSGSKKSDDKPEIKKSPFRMRELVRLWDRFTVTDDEVLYGRINVLTAPVEVLAALPRMDEGRAESIAAARENLDPRLLATPTWLVTQGLLTLAEFRLLDQRQLLTTRSYQFHLEAVADLPPRGARPGQQRRVEAVVDLMTGRPQIMYWRDLTHLGRAYDWVKLEGDLY